MPLGLQVAAAQVARPYLRPDSPGHAALILGSRAGRVKQLFLSSGNKKKGREILALVRSNGLTYQTLVSRSLEAGAIKSTDIITLSAVMATMENTNSLRAQTLSFEVL